MNAVMQSSHLHCHRYFVCHGCMAHIEVPVPINPETARMEIPWPAGEKSQNFLCFTCWQASPYLPHEFLLNFVPTAATDDICATDAVFQLSVSCRMSGCASVVEIHIVMPKDSNMAAGVAIAPQMIPMDIACKQHGHRHAGASIRNQAFAFHVDTGWSHLAWH